MASFKNGFAWGAAIVALLSGCALPRPATVETQDFVSRKEIVLARILRDAQKDYGQGRMFDAELELRQALLLAPDTTQIQLNLGRVLARNGQIEEAQKAFDAVLKRRPKDVPTLNFAGESFFEGGKFDIAEQYFERAHQISLEFEKAQIPDKSVIIDPDNVDRTLRNLSTLYFRDGNLIDALCIMNEAYAKRTTFDNLARLVRVEMALGDYANAEMRLTTFLVANPGFSDGRFYMLRALARLGTDQREKAIEDIKAAQKRDDTIAEYAMELRVFGEILIVPEEVEGEEVEESEDDGAGLEEFKPSQRLYLPLTVLRLFDEYQEQLLLKSES